jgi:hypothetical protein
LILGGFFSEKYGGKWFLGLGSLVTSVFTLLTPVAAKWGTEYLVNNWNFRPDYLLLEFSAGIFVAGIFSRNFCRDKKFLQF